jgi:hypothetical protein
LIYDVVLGCLGITATLTRDFPAPLRSNAPGSQGPYPKGNGHARLKCSSTRLLPISEPYGGRSFCVSSVDVEQQPFISVARGGDGSLWCDSSLYVRGRFPVNSLSTTGKNEASSYTFKTINEVMLKVVISRRCSIASKGQYLFYHKHVVLHINLAVCLNPTRSSRPTLAHLLKHVSNTS